MVNRTNKGWRSLLCVGTFLNLDMSKSPVQALSIELKFIQLIELSVRSKHTKFQADILNDMRVIDEKLF